MGICCFMSLGYFWMGSILNLYTSNDRINELNNIIKESVLRKYTTYTVSVVGTSGQPSSSTPNGFVGNGSQPAVVRIIQQ